MQVGVAVIGCGYWGKNLVRNFSALGALRGVCDLQPEVAERFAGQYGVPHMSLEAALADPQVHGVVVAVPAELHYRFARQALEAGKHVYVEKPLALDLREAEELCRLAAVHQRLLMVGHLLHYHPAFEKLLAMVREGALGQVRYIYSNRLNLGKIRREENALWSFAPHDISMILALVGEEPDRVEATGAAYLHKVIADVTTTHMRFPGGQQAHVFVSWLHPFKEQKLVVVGGQGMMVFNDGNPWDSKLLFYPHKIQWRDGMPMPDRKEPQPLPVAEDEPLKRECAHFLACIRDGGSPRTDGHEGVRVLRVLAAAQRAMDQGCGVFPGREEAREPSRRSPAVPAAERFPGVRVHESAYVDDGVVIGAGSRVWHFSHLLPGTRLGGDVVVGQNVVIGPRVTVGDNCKIQNNVSLYEGVTLEEGVFCGPSCVFTNVSNPRAEVSRKHEFRPTLVKRGATIGANATIVCGHTIGRYAFIAAGAVVIGDVPDFALMAGVPAKRIGWMSRAGMKLGSDLACPLDGSRYREAGPDRLEAL